MKFLNSSEDSIDLEGKTPSLGFGIVLFQHVDVFSAEILPFRNRLFNPLGFGNLLSKDL